MPDIIRFLGRRWKFIILLTFAATLVALIGCLLSPKQYLGVVTALPVNAAVNDKARIFNQNIEALYSEIGTADELDKVEATSKLDTLYLAVANDFRLSSHYGIDISDSLALDKAAQALKKNTAINRSGFGELKINVWDRDKRMAADLANALLQKINAIHQHLQTENNRMVLQQLEDEYAQKLQQFDSSEKVVLELKSVPHEYELSKQNHPDSINHSTKKFAHTSLEQASLQEQLKEYARLINEYELAVKTTPKVLLAIEHARPSPWPDKPKTGQTLLLTFFASLLFSFLLAFFVESRQYKA